MSRAFTKEIDDAPPAPIPDRPVSAAPNLVTPRGAELIRNEVARIDAALREGAGPVEELLREQRYWSARQASMQITPLAEAPAAISFGVIADIRRRGRKSSITIVGEDEADPSSGLLAWTSPLAQALEGAEPGEMIEFEAGGQTEGIEVLSIRRR